ncbi:hypothetical protein CVIRNUC_007080 [Coccomyxa viridis]|uniref:Extracellular protein n=1 Tax=Coccomyxa viridis TaxID=1274662 RepID=A0AAV1IBI2_9CHLO|nr:hypothetical protein CVIRNUC_007080 [Coccomyxa viridis]
MVSFNLLQARTSSTFRQVLIAGCMCLALTLVAGQQFTNTDCHTAGQFIQTTCADFTAVIKQRFNEINNADCGSLSENIGGGQYGRPGPQCCRNATNYFGQDCYNNPNSDRGVDYYHYHAALGGWNTSTLNAGRRLTNIMCANRPCNS